MKDIDQKRGWPLDWERLLERPSSNVATIISVLAISTFIALIAIGLLAISWLLLDLLSGEQKRAAEAAKAALPVLAGAIGLPLIIWRLLILERQTKISENKTQIDRETHYTSIFSRAIEQLGQTREIKRTIHSEEGSNDTTTTVPNIEVRLGGIHSLSRLAEESIRDREKVENILRSYIRENSWSDKSGQVAERLSWPRNEWEGWVYRLLSNYSDVDFNAAKEKWVAQTVKNINRTNSWADLPETRVDVNESADALEIQTSKRNPAQKPFLYECLFVDRHFSGEFLKQI